MSVDSKGRELFIVDNSVSGWTGLRYLEEWCSIAKAFDIATGYFEINALLALDGKWQGLDKIRLLMGAETTHRTRRAILEAVRAQALDRLDESIEEDKQPNPFLRGVPAILDALRSGQIECRVYDKDKFHAKTYITHAKLEVVGAQALVGSSNFTRPGLTKNIELNVQVQSAREVAQLQEWFETHWAEAREVSEAVIETISRHTRLYSPFDVYAKALQQFFRGHELTATEWDETRSRMFPHLDRYQKEAYWALMKIARQHSGAFLCDGVGLGKTFVGLMLIERLILHEGKRVVLFAPKAAKEGVWEPHLRRWLPHIGGVSGGADFSNLAVFSHTDLGRKGDFPERFQRIAELADVVVIDEAHHFRNPGRQSDPDNGIEPSRYYRLFDLLDNAERPKTLFMLTATPINNRLSDFRHMTELFTRRDEAYFARTIGVNHLRAHFNQMEKTLRSRVGQDAADAAEHVTEAQEILLNDEIFRQLVVQRSRTYARESQIREYRKAAAFPERKDPQVAAYSIRKTYGRMLDLFEKAFAKQSPLFTLPMYYPLHWYRGPNQNIDAFEENRQKQVVGLIRTNFLKRFESSVAAFELSCDRLLQKLLAFLHVHSESDAEKKRLERWRAQKADVLGHVSHRQLELWGEEGEEADDEDVLPQEMLDTVERLDRAEYHVEEMMSETFLDLDQIVEFLDEARKFEPKHDDKLQKLIRLLKSKALSDQKLLIFTEFADTARYLKRRLDVLGMEQFGADAGVFERLEWGFPVDPGAFHRGGGDAMRPQPVGHRPQSVGQRAELLDDGARQAAADLVESDGGGDAHLVDIETGRPRLEHVHVVDGQRFGVNGVDGIERHRVPSLKAEAGGPARCRKHPPRGGVRFAARPRPAAGTVRGSMPGAAASVWTTGKGRSCPDISYDDCSRFRLSRMARHVRRQPTGASVGASRSRFMMSG